MKDRDNVYDWYNVYICVNFIFEVFVDGVNVVGDIRLVFINSVFFLIKV